MFFTSTRQKLNVTAAQAIAQGISKDGGLFVPSEFPKFSQEMLDKLVNMNYKERACAVLSAYLNDFSDDCRSYATWTCARSYASGDATPHGGWFGQSAEEGRVKQRYASGRCTKPMIRRLPNGTSYSSE